MEEYTTLIRCPKIQADKAYSRVANVPTFLKKLMRGMSEQWVAARIKKKGDSKCIPWKNLRDLILAHPDMKKRINVFTLSIYGLVVFPKALGFIHRLDKRVTPISVILAETFRSLSACRRASEGRFIGHFWKIEKVSYRVFSESYSLLKELVATSRQDYISKEKWMAILQSLQDEDVEWRAPWIIPDEILYWCGDFDCGAVGYAHLLLLRQYRSRQFILATQRLAQCEFSYKGDNYTKKVHEISNTWNQTL
ncbi:hypothetical protein EPI10_024294 [Gossypium australe]|uniref:DUF7745 domain-containing protein n=1 Tax=Gossypium australe TaxID=47621 RepID=A0A5B6VWK0_9ROSI|nr:hypothetical protein EPI10_024294 [Gossypium australe]